MQFNDHPILVTLLPAPLSLPTIAHIFTCTDIVTQTAEMHETSRPTTSWENQIGANTKMLIGHKCHATSSENMGEIEHFLRAVRLHRSDVTVDSETRL